MLELKTSYQSGILNIELYGALDSLTAPDFKYWLTQKSISGYHYFALNCGGLEYISSRGIGIITELNNVLNAADSRMILYHVSNEVLNLLNFLKLSEYILIVDTYAHLKDKFGDKPAQKAQKKDTLPVLSEEVPLEDEYTGITASPEKVSKEDLTADGQAGFNSTEVLYDQQLNLKKGNLETIHEEYIDLSKVETSTAEYDVAQMNIVFCPNCGQHLRVSKKGLYLCPDCRIQFNYPF